MLCLLLFQLGSAGAAGVVRKQSAVAVDGAAALDVAGAGSCSLRLLSGRTAECGWDGIDAGGQSSLIGEGHSLQTCLDDCLAQPGCNFAASSVRGFCHRFSTCDGVGDPTGWTVYKKDCGVYTGGGAPALPGPAFPHVVSVLDQLGLRALQVGNVKAGQQLRPQLVPPPGSKFKFKSRERIGFTDMVWQDRNKYNLELDKIKRSGFPDQDIDAEIIKTETHMSMTGGHRTIHVSDKDGRDLFNVRMTRHTWNPVNIFGRYTFRIVPPGSKDNDDPLFTINRDRYFGFTQTWRVYRGRQRDNQELYRCEGKWWRSWGAKMQVYRGGTDTQVGEIKQAINAGYVMARFPDTFSIEVDAGEDSALLLMLSVIIDSTQDQKDEAEQNDHYDRRSSYDRHRVNQWDQTGFY